MKRTAPEIESAAVELYQSGLSARQVGSQLGLPHKTVLRILVSCGIKRRPCMRRGATELTKREKQGIIRLYKSGFSSRAVAEKVGRSAGIVQRLVCATGISRKLGHPRQAPLNESFFDKINSEESAYALGFLAADGNVTGLYINLSLAAKDKNHLEKIRDILSPGRKLYKIKARQDRRGCKPQDQYKLVLYSAYMVESLGRLGIGPHKTTSLRPCTQVPERFKQAYWRGFFDGDGTIGKYETSTGTQWRVSVSGTHAMMLGFWKWAKEFVPKLKKPIKTRALKDGSGFWRVSCGGTAKPKLLARVLYLGAGIALERKRQMAEELMQFEVRRKTKAYAVS